MSQRLVGPMFVVVPRVLCQHPLEVSFAVDKQVVKALAAQRLSPGSSWCSWETIRV